MKLLLRPLLLLLAVAAIAGCKKSHNQGPAPTIIGKWDYQSDTIKYYNYGYLSQTDVNTGTSSGGYFVFNSDGTGKSFKSAVTLTFTYQLSGYKLTINYDPYTTGSFTVPASTEVASVRSLTSDGLFIYFDDKFTTNGLSSEVVNAIHMKKE